MKEPGMLVYISHANADREIARKLSRQLAEHGLTPWLDEDELFPGDNWGAKIGEALGAADAMVILMSPDAAKSESVRRDIGYVLSGDRFKDRVVPVIIRPTAKMPWILQRMNVIKATKNLALTSRRVADRLNQVLQAA